MVTYFLQDDGGCITSFCSLADLQDFLEPGYESEILAIFDSKGNTFQVTNGIVSPVPGGWLTPENVKSLLSGDSPVLGDGQTLENLIEWHERNSKISG